MSVIKKSFNHSFFKVSNLIELLSDPSFVLLITVVLSIALPKFIKVNQHHTCLIYRPSQERLFDT